MDATDYKLLVGDCRETLRQIPDKSVHTCVTSPPYFGLRDYGVAGQMGQEATPDEFVAALVEVFREVRRVLRDDGTMWLNLGDSYASGGRKTRDQSSRNKGNAGSVQGHRAQDGLKPKDLIGIPWMVAFALRADGWYLRQDIIWQKPNPMPESVRDRCTKSHEYIFLLSKSPKYYFDHDAIAEPLASSSIARLSQPNLENQKGSDRVPGKTNGNMKAVGRVSGGWNGSKFHTGKTGEHQQGSASVKRGGFDGETYAPHGLESFQAVRETRNKRSVWNVSTKPYKGAHFATFPPDLIEPCVLAGCPVGGTVLDPFGGSGTTAGVALRHGRNAILCELNAEYAKLVPHRIASISGPRPPSTYEDPEWEDLIGEVPA